jgi:hypothetical protein
VREIGECSHGELPDLAVAESSLVLSNVLIRIVRYRRTTRSVATPFLRLARAILRFVPNGEDSISTLALRPCRCDPWAWAASARRAVLAEEVEVEAEAARAPAAL